MKKSTHHTTKINYEVGLKPHLNSTHIVLSDFAYNTFSYMCENCWAIFCVSHLF